GSDHGSDQTQCAARERWRRGGHHAQLGGTDQCSARCLVRDRDRAHGHAGHPAAGMGCHPSCAQWSLNGARLLARTFHCDYGHDGTAHRPSGRGFMSLRFVTGALLALTVASSPALACKGPNVIFADDFAEADPGWGTSETVVIASSSIQLKSKPGGVAGSLYNGSFFEDADICIHLPSPAPTNPTSVHARLVLC